MLSAEVFGLNPRILGRWLCASVLALQALGVRAAELDPPKAQEAARERPSAIVHKQYSCYGGKTLKVRYQLGERSVHAFAWLQGKMRELPWDGDYKMEHDEDERFSDGRYEILVQGNFSRVSTVRRLPVKANAKARELFRTCRLHTAPAGNRKARSAGGSLNKPKAPTPTLTPMATPIATATPIAAPVSKANPSPTAVLAAP
ncbi:MAG: hypothetical protein ACH34Y_05055 [Brachymonas sp.]